MRTIRFLSAGEFEKQEINKEENIPNKNSFENLEYLSIYRLETWDLRRGLQLRITISEPETRNQKPETKKDPLQYHSISIRE